MLSSFKNCCEKEPSKLYACLHDCTVVLRCCCAEPHSCVRGPLRQTAVEPIVPGWLSRMEQLIQVESSPLCSVYNNITLNELSLGLHCRQEATFPKLSVTSGIAPDNNCYFTCVLFHCTFHCQLISVCVCVSRLFLYCTCTFSFNLTMLGDAHHQRHTQESSRYNVHACTCIWVATCNYASTSICVFTQQPKILWANFQLMSVDDCRSA